MASNLLAMASSSLEALLLVEGLGGRPAIELRAKGPKRSFMFGGISTSIQGIWRSSVFALRGPVANDEKRDKHTLSYTIPSYTQIVV